MGAPGEDRWADGRAAEPAGGSPPAGQRASAASSPNTDGFEADLTDETLTAEELADAERVVDEALADSHAGSDPHAGGALAAERDEYRDALMRVKADFDNYKKRVAKDQAATVERAAEQLVSDLLPVLDACEAALAHGATDVEPIHRSMMDVLEKGGLVRMDAAGQPFDPNLHEAVMHEPGDDDTPETVVVDSLRTGYLWNGRVVRPAMVKVRG